MFVFPFSPLEENVKEINIKLAPESCLRVLIWTLWCVPLLLAYLREWIKHVNKKKGEKWSKNGFPFLGHSRKSKNHHGSWHRKDDGNNSYGYLAIRKKNRVIYIVIDLVQAQWLNVYSLWSLKAGIVCVCFCIRVDFCQLPGHGPSVFLTTFRKWFAIA